MTESMVFACGRRSDGHWRELSVDEMLAWSPDDGLLWVHLDAQTPETREYFNRHARLDGIVQDALLAEETRPRVAPVGDGLLAIFRGVNLNPGADPEDMVSIRMWLDANRIITTRRRKLMAVTDLRERLATGRGPASTGELFTDLVGRLVNRMSGVIEDLDAETDQLETQVIEAPGPAVRTHLTAIRRQAITLRRYLAPQREALNQLQALELSWLDDRRKANLREVTDRVTRYVEDLDSLRERAAVIQDEVVNRLSEQMNQHMYLLTIVATVMLPLGFITGLLGINVDGIPGASDTPWAFGAVSAGLVILVAAQLWWLKRHRWF